MIHECSIHNDYIRTQNVRFLIGLMGGRQMRADVDWQPEDAEGSWRAFEDYSSPPDRFRVEFVERLRHDGLIEVDDSGRWLLVTGAGQDWLRQQ